MIDLLPLHMPQAKKCIRCQEYKDWEYEFTKRADQKDGKNYWCTACARIANAAQYSKDREKRLEIAANYREPRREELREWQADYRKRFPLKSKAVNKKWRTTHQPQRRLLEQNREARKRGLPHTWTIEQMAFMLDYWHQACAVCGNEQGLWWIRADDHWIPLNSSHCPGTIATNMIPLCHGEGGCNNSKHGFEPHAWLIKRFGAKKAAHIEKKIETYFQIVRTTFNTKGT